MNWRKIFPIVAPLLFTQVAFAHAVGTSYITVEQNSDHLQTRVDLTLRDLEFGVGLDSNSDGQITWGEVLANSPAVTQYIENHLSVSRGGERCALGSPDIAIDRHADEVYAVITLQTQCATPGAITVQSNLMFELDDSHRSLLTAKTDAGNTVTVLTASSRAWTETHARFAAWNAFIRFIGQGIWHIWIGFDHLAFLMLLLLPLSRGHVDAVPTSAAHSIKQILKVVTAFTAAHSITLACAALGYVQLPSRWTEAAIAASIVIAAIANLMNRTDRFGIAMAFGFGLIHGLGFASALADITTNTTSRVLPLIGFNLGVEIGQLAVVAAVFPFLFLWNSSPQFKQRTVMAGSTAMGALGIAWLVQRTLLF